MLLMPAEALVTMATSSASVPGTGSGSVGGVVPFMSLHENQRAALLLSNGVVYVAFGAHGDVLPYHGWVLGYDATTLQQTMAVNLSPSAEGGGIWQANGGPSADAAGHVYVVTGNGTFDTTGPTRQNYGDTVVKITPAGAVTDFFTPHDQDSIDANNFDLGAAGAMLLPDQPGAHPHLLVSAGKNNTVYLIDRDNMGQFNPNNDNQIVQSLVNIFPFGTPEPGNYSAPVYFNGTVYFGPVRDNIQAFRLTNGLLSPTATDRTTDVFNYIEIAEGRIWLLPDGIDCFAGDLSEEEQKLVWATQAVPSADLFDQKVSGAAWKSKPSWYIVANNDRTVHPDLERFVANRMGANTYDVDSSHVHMLSQPRFVLDVIRAAAAAVEESATAAV